MGTQRDHCACGTMIRAPASQLSLVFHVEESRDAWLASVLPPFMRARRFVEHVGSLSASSWEDIFRNASSNAAARIHAAWGLDGATLSADEQCARDALLRIVREAVHAARVRGALHESVASHATSLVSNGALALALRDRLMPEAFDALYHPFSPGCQEPCSPWSRQRGSVPRHRPRSAR